MKKLDSRSPLTIMGEQRGTIEKQKLIIDELNTNYLKLNGKLEDAQKEIGVLATTNMQLEKRNVELEGKIEAVKQILEKWCKECGEADYGPCENDCYIHDLKDILIPRKEESEK